MDTFKHWGYAYQKILFGKGNALGVIAKAVFSFLFALTIMLGRLIVFKGIFGNVHENYFMPFSFRHVVIFSVAFITSYLVVGLIELFVQESEKKTSIQRKNKKRWIFFAFAAVLIICWLPYYLSYFPGGVYSDTYLSIGQAKGELALSNHHPILYTGLIKLFISIGTLLGRGMQFSIGLFTLAQFTALALTLAYFLYWMYKHKVANVFLILCTAFFSLFPLFPFYAVSVWKDTPFSIALFLYILCILNIVVSDGTWLKSWWGIAKYCVCTMLVAFLRNNGLYIVFAVTVFILFAYWEKVLRALKWFTAFAALTLAGIFIVQGPIYDKLGLNTTKQVESYGCLLQHIAYVASVEGEINEEQIAFLDRIMPMEEMKRAYAPCIVDTIKWSDSFDQDYLNEHKNEFLRVWASIALKNPGSAIKAHLLETLGFWDVTRGTEDAYIQTGLWFGEYDGMHEVDYFAKFFGFSFANLVKPRYYWSAALFIWFALLCMTVAISQKKYRFVLVYLAPLTLWATIMLATPIAFSLRYAYIFVPFMPVAALVPFLPYKPGENKTQHALESVQAQMEEN